MKSITKITGFSLIGKKKMLTLAKTDNFQEFFSHKLDGNKLLYKCAKFQVNSFCGLDFSRGGGGIFLFCCSECLHGLFLSSTLKIFKYWINLLVMKCKLINFNWVVNNLIVHNLLIIQTYSVQKQLLTVFCSCFKNSEAVINRCSSK